LALARSLRLNRNYIHFWEHQKQIDYGPLHEYFEPQPASEPTETPRGSKERIAVYRQRYDRGEELFHPDDSRSGVVKNDAQPTDIELANRNRYDARQKYLAVWRKRRKERLSQRHNLRHEKPTVDAAPVSG
jgi:hypothetical protein